MGNIDWLPIDSAPKDGTRVLISDGVDMEVAKNLGDGWVSSDGLDFGYGNWDQELTHWAEINPPGDA
jgi:hypothetical protein